MLFLGLILFKEIFLKVRVEIKHPRVYQRKSWIINIYCDLNIKLMISSIYENCIEILLVLVRVSLDLKQNQNWRYNTLNQYKNLEKLIIQKMYLKVNIDL